MTLDQLRAFVAVAESLSMTRAAETVHLSQPAVSAAIAALETRHDTRLFDRIGRRLALTEAGHAFLPEARAVLQRADAARRVLDDLSGLARGELILFASQTVATYWLPQRMARFVAAHPGVTLPLTVGNTAQAIAAIVEGRADLGFIEGAVDHSGIVREPVGGDRLGFYVAPAHPLAGRAVTTADLASAAWVVREPGSGTREHFAAGIKHFGLGFSDLDIRLEMPSNGAVLEAVEAGELIAAVSDLAAAPRLRAGQLVRLDCEMPPRTFKLIRHRDRYLSRAAHAFRASLEHAAHSHAKF